MAWLLDTNIVIHLIEGDARLIERIESLSSRPLVSVVTMVEVYGGLARGGVAPNLRARVTAVAAALTTLDFGQAEAACYDRIVAHSGYARGRILDRMIAAQALVAEAVLVTRNTNDFLDIPGLQTELW